jgi:hypothetical protein
MSVGPGPDVGGNVTVGAGSSVGCSASPSGGGSQQDGSCAVCCGLPSALPNLSPNLPAFPFTLGNPSPDQPMI